MTHQASCCCGQLTLKYPEAITKSALCHCTECQKRTGSVFGAQVALKREKAVVNGNSTIYKRRGDEGGQTTFHFCPTCGTTVYWFADGMPEAIIAAVGAFADQNFAAPTFSVYEDRMHHWLKLPDSITEHMA